MISLTVPYADCFVALVARSQPSALQATVASSMPQLSSHTGFPFTITFPSVTFGPGGLGVLLLLALRQRPVAQLMCGHILGFRVVVVGVVEGVVVVVVEGVWTTVVVVVTVIVVDFVVVVG